MDFATFSEATKWVLTHGYPLIFLAMLIEGPIVTAAAAFAVALGYFNLRFIFILSLLGDVVADVIYYAIGYWGRLALVERYGLRLGISKEKILKLENLLHTHSIKTMIFLKLAPVLPTPGLMLTGALRMNLKKFTLISLFITLPKSILFMIIGYYFGQAYGTISHYIQNTGYLIVLIVALFAVIYYIYTKVSTGISKKIEKI